MRKKTTARRRLKLEYHAVRIPQPLYSRVAALRSGLDANNEGLAMSGAVTMLLEEACDLHERRRRYHAARG